MEQYFIMAIIVTVIVMRLFTYGVYKNVKLIQQIMDAITPPFQKVMYLFFMYSFSYAYIYIVLCFDGVFGAAICSIALLLIISIADLFFEWLFGGSNVAFAYKQWAIIISYVGLIVSGIIIFIQYDSIEYLKVSSIAISVLIGSFIPVMLLIKNNTDDSDKSTNLLKEGIKNKILYFKETSIIVLVKHFFKNTLYALALGTLMVLCFSPHIDVINQIFSGIGFGIAVFLAIFICNRKKKEKTS